MSNRFKENPEEVLMTISHDDEKKIVNLEFISAEKITGAELLHYLGEFIEGNVEEPELIFEDCEEIERTIN